MRCATAAFIVLLPVTLMAAAPAAPTPAAARKPPAVAWETAADHVTLKFEGRTLYAFHFNPADGKPYFHPLSLPDGTVLTDFRPADHIWHRGLWWSWKFIDGLNYWEEEPGTFLSQGRTQLLKADAKRTGDTVCVVLDLQYRPPRATTAVLTEHRTLVLGTPAADGRYRIDWTSVFTAGAREVKLARTPPPGEPDGKPWGGYAGLAFRFAPAAREWTFLGQNGGGDVATLHGFTNAWLNVSRPLAKGGGGVTILDHPANPRHATPWYVDPTLPFFQPAPLFREPLTIPAGGTLTFRYRIEVQPGVPDPAALEKAWKAFAEEKAP